MAQTTPQVIQHLTANMNLSKKQIMINNFLGGLAWGFGTVVGASVVFGILGYILKLLGVFSALGNFISQITGVAP